MNLRRDVFQAIADPTRGAILLLVASQSMSVGAIASNFDTARPTLSKHLQILTECELLKQEQSGRKIYYQLNSQKIKEIADFIEPFSQMWDDRFNKLEDIMKTIKTNNMERKTKINVEDGKQDLVITREFELPLELLFKAYTEADILEQWMETRVLKLESRKHGGYQFETSDPQGNVVFRANGVIHEFVPNQKITRTFEMENTPFPVQLEFLEFEQLTPDTSKLNIHIVYRSVEFRDQVMQLPFAQGVNMAHDHLQRVVSKLKISAI